MRLINFNPIDEMTKNFKYVLNNMPDYNDCCTGLKGVEIYEENDHLFVNTELPGVKKEDINIRLENGLLTIRADRRVEDNENRHYYWNERNYGSYEKAMKLPVEVDPDSVEADYEAGVVSLKIKKFEEEKVKSKEIEIK